MATITEIITLEDRMSTQLGQIGRILESIDSKMDNVKASSTEMGEAISDTKAPIEKSKQAFSVWGMAAGQVIGNVITQIGQLVAQIPAVGDQLMSMTARLNMVGVSNDAVYNSAMRVRGSYTAMGDTISKLGILAGDAFKDQDEILSFTELMQKSFKVGGAGAQEQASAMYQLTQAMAAGKLQGDEFRSIIENAPMLADSISKYMGVSKGALKEMSSEGVITADIIKNAMFSVSDEITSKFDDMPTTFSESMNKLKNVGLKRFGGLLTGITNMMSDAVNSLADYVESNFDQIVAGLSMISLAVAGFAVFWAVSWAVANWPVLAVVAAILLLFEILQEFGLSTEQIIGGVCGVFSFLGATVWNVFLSLTDIVFGVVNYLISLFSTLANHFMNMFENPVSSNIYMMQEFADSILGIIEQIALAIDNVFGTKLATGVAGWRSGLKEMADAAVEKLAPNENYEKKIDFALSTEKLGWERMEYGSAWDSGWQFGTSLNETIGKGLGAVTDAIGGTNNLLSGEGSLKSSGDVTIKDDNLKWLLDIATLKQVRDYKAADITVQVTTGDVHTEADENRLANIIVCKLTDCMCSSVAHG